MPEHADCLITDRVNNPCCICGKWPEAEQKVHVFRDKFYCHEHCAFCVPEAHPFAEWSAEQAPVSGEQKSLF